MELHERIRELRKHHLHLSQTDFGARLGVSLSVINNIELNRLARPDQKLSLMKLICKEFSVSEAWLMDGTGPMFAEPETFNLQDFASERHITELETEIVKTYLELDPAVRKTVLEHFKNRLTPAAAPEEKTVEQLEAEYKKSRSNSARNAGSGASSIIEERKDA